MFFFFMSSFSESFFATFLWLADWLDDGYGGIAKLVSCLAVNERSRYIELYTTCNLYDGGFYTGLMTAVNRDLWRRTLAVVAAGTAAVRIAVAAWILTQISSKSKTREKTSNDICGLQEWPEREGGKMDVF